VCLYSAIVTACIVAIARKGILRHQVVLAPRRLVGKRFYPARCVRQVFLGLHDRTAIIPSERGPERVPRFRKTTWFVLIACLTSWPRLANAVAALTPEGPRSPIGAVGKNMASADRDSRRNLRREQMADVTLGTRWFNGGHVTFRRVRGPQDVSNDPQLR